MSTYNGWTNYALAFMSDVNWREIAEHMLEEATE